jgi:small conductance mechanosensitive channel
MAIRNFLHPLALILCLGLALAAVGLAPGGDAHAQEENAGTAPKKVLQDLVSTLRDDDERQALIEQIEALIAAHEGVESETQPPEPEGFAGRLLAAATTRMEGAANLFSLIAEHFERAPKNISYLWGQAHKPEVLGKWGEIALKISAVFAVGLLTEWIAKSLLARSPRRRADADERILMRLLSALGRTFWDLLPVAVFTLAAYAVLSFIEPRPVTRLLALAVINANVSVRIVLALSRFVLAPDRPELRLIPLGEESAAYGYIWIRRLVSVGVYGYFFAEAALLLGVSVSAYDLLLKLIGLVLTSVAIVLVLQNKISLAAWIRDTGADGQAVTGGSWSTLRGQIAAVWHIVAITFLTILFGTWALDIPGGFEYLARASSLSLLIIALAMGLNRAIGAALNRGLAVSQGLADRFPLLEVRVNRYLPALRGLLKGLIYFVTALLVLQFWGIGTVDWITSETGVRALANLLAIVLIAGAALLFWEFLSVLIERTLERRASTKDGPRSARLLTLLPLLRNAVRVVLVVMVTLIIFSQIGIDIGPLLAGAGVVGLAVGFGAQALVKDIITGAFILIEDSLAVGDWVDLGPHSGTVEAMTIRTVTLRDLDGSIHVIPFGEVTSVLNYNRGFGYTLVDVGVAYRENVEEVISVLQEIGSELAADEEYGPSLLEPLEVIGVNNLADSAVEIRVRIKTKPMMQWRTKRALLRVIKRTFDERGIEIPFPHRTIYFGLDKSGEAPPIHIAEQPTQG